MSKKFKCTQADCTKEYNDAAHLGIHLRAAHGILGRSANAIKNRELKAAQAAAKLPEPAPIAEAVTKTAQPKRKYKKRSLQLAKQTLPPIASNGAGVNHSNQEGHFAPDSVSEVTLAIAYGRFQELCRSVSFEFDVPPKLFAQRLAELIYRAQVR